MSLKRFRFSSFALALALLAVTAGTALAHTNMPQPSTTRTVAAATSTINPDLGKAMYTSIQAAVNDSKEGDIIEILDEAVYGGQVTIEGREDSSGARWTGVVGGKNWITIRYVPPSASATARPTIRHCDRVNQSPKTPAEAKTPGDKVGTSGNFETNGALRIIRAQGIKIEGIAVDGDSAVPFNNPGVWCGNNPGDQCYPLFHGNAAIAVAVSGSVQIRDCRLKNAYFGIAVKDRNTGGVFGNPNPADNDLTIPLSGFGQTGNHVFEYNRIDSNHVGIYFESSWDRGSTVRYNLITSNFVQARTRMPSDDGDAFAGGLFFKDNYLSPVAIYNNTFWNNNINLGGHWQVGFQHLIFNNIFARHRSGNTYKDNLNIEGMFPHRMKHCVFSAHQTLVVQNQGHYCPGDQLFVTDAQSQTLGNAARVQRVLRECTNGSPNGQTRTENVVNPGATFPGRAGAAFATDANNRWLEMAGYGTGSSSLPMLFKSISPASPDFLVPNWDSSAVKTYIRNAGWAASGITNEDGTVADLGAIPFEGKRPGDGVAQTSRVRISPFSVVTISGTTATAKITVNQEIGGLTGNLTIKYIRWVTPIPDNSNPSVPDGSFGGADKGKTIAAASIRTVPSASTVTLSSGPNVVNFTLTSALTAADTNGFFEIVLEGKDGTRTVVSDVGFIPYRRLAHFFRIEVMNGNNVVPNPVVTAGTAVSLRVTAMARGSGGTGDTPYNTGASSGTPLEVDYSLSLPGAKLWRIIDPNPGNALTYDPNLGSPPATTGQYSKIYTVYFTKAGAEIVSAAGLWTSGNNRLPFLGDLQVTVRPGAPAQVAFQNPIPSRETRYAPPVQDPPVVMPPTIVGTYDVVVQVQDKWANPVDVRVPVTITPLQPLIGGVQETAPVFVDTTSGENRGNAKFTAVVNEGASGEMFDLQASATSGALVITPDTGSLRVGRATDQLRVFYHNSVTTNGKGDWRPDFDLDDEYGYGHIDTLVGNAVQVWVKLMHNVADTVITSRNQALVCVTSSDPNIQFSATAAGTFAAGPHGFGLTGGVGSFWIKSQVPVDEASLTVSAKSSSATDCGGIKDNGITDGSRGSIMFTKPSGDVGAAIVSGNGYGRPVTVTIAFNGADGGFNTTPVTWRMPDSVKLSWPGICAAAPSATSTAITVVSRDTLSVAFPPAVFPEGFTAVTSPTAIVTIYGAIEAGTEYSPNAIIDAIGPLIGRAASGSYCDIPASGPFMNPTFEENKSPGVTPDVLRLQLTETLADLAQLEGNSILISSDSLGTAEKPLAVASAALVNGVVTLTLAPTSVLEPYYWIRLNPAVLGITDATGNRVAADNRRVQIFQTEAPAGIASAWYTSADNSGIIDYVYISFDKPVTAAGLSEWFNGGNISFNWNGTAALTVSTANIDNISIYPEVPNTIRVKMDALGADLSRLTGTPGNIKTGGNMTVTVTYGSGKAATGWVPVSAPAADKANPVLVRAILQKGSVNDKDEYDPDTLILTFSEPTLLRLNIAELTDAVSVSTSPTGSWLPVLRKMDDKYFLHTPADPYVEVRFVVDLSMRETQNFNPSKNGEYWVKINDLLGDAGVADQSTPANVQKSPENHRVALEILLGKPFWRTKVKNNPFRDYVIVETTPGPGMIVEAQIKLYDSMGKLVLEETGYNDGTVTGAKQTLDWKWEGKNKSGRYVGTGTYLFKAVYTVKNNAGIVPEQVTKSIGFVRGKN